MSKKIVVLTGAGISAESGIATFRGAGGLWNNYPVSQVATPEGYYRNPELVLRFYNERRHELLHVQPNGAHRILAEMERDYGGVTIITQNVDDLHERAGSRHVIHLHGELLKATSSRDPNNPACIRTLTPDESDDLKVGDKAADGSQLRPFIVWFGEPVPRIEEAVAVTEQADVFIVVGTSLAVYPAAGLLQYVPAGVPVFLIDPEQVAVPAHRNVCFIRKGATEGMKELREMLKAQNILS